jgi:hypothetical protein
VSARILTCSDSEYYADPCDVPSLSPSIAKLLLHCPSKAWLAHPKLGGQGTDRTKAMKAGSVIDELLTTNGDRVQVVANVHTAKGDLVEYPANWNLKSAQERRDQLESEGFLPVLRHEYENAKATVAAIIAKAEAMRCPINRGVYQLAMAWTETADDGTEVQCRCKLDYCEPERGVIRDLKRLASAHPESCVRAMSAFGYDIQGAAYRRAFVANHPRLVGRESFQLICVEDKPPYPVTPVDLTGGFLALGESKWQRAVNLWARCLRDNVWPDYVTGPVRPEPKPWMIEDEFSKGDNEYDEAI